jgi:hypothetical protein
MIRRMRSVTLCVALMVPFFANAARNNLNASVRGLYALTATLNCLQSPSGFAGFAAQAPGATSYSAQVQAVLRYNGDGTGTILSGTVQTLYNFGGPFIGNGTSGPLGFSKMSDLSADFTYTVGWDHSIHLISGPVTVTETVGSDVGNPLGTVVITGIQLQGYASEDFGTIVYSTAVPNPPQLPIEHVTTGGGMTLQRICNRSRTEVRIDDGSSRSLWPFGGH